MSSASPDRVDPGSKAAEAAGSVPSAAADGSKAPPRRPRRLGRRILVLLAILVVLVAVGVPFAVPRFAKGPLLQALADAGYPGSEVADLGFSWPADITMEGLEVKDARGRPVASVRELEIDAGLLGLIAGNYAADVKIRGAEVVLREEDFAPKPPSGSGPAPARKPDAGSPAPVRLPSLKATVDASECRLVIAARDGTTSVFDDLGAKVTVDGWDSPVKFDVRVLGKTTGGVRADGELAIARGGVLDLDGLRGRIAYAVEKLDLRALAPLARGSGQVERMEGVVEGKGAFDLASLTDATGDGNLTVTGLALAGPAFGTAPVTVASLRVHDVLKKDAAGNGRAELTLELDRFLKAVVTSSLPPGGAERREYAADARIDGDLDGLSRAMGGLLRLKEGSRLAGKLGFDFRASGVMKASDYDSGTLTVRGGLTDLAAFDRTGKPLPVDPRMDLDVSAAYAAAGAARVERATFTMGKVKVEASGGGDLEKRSLSPSSLTAEADLDDLAAKLGSFLDLPVAFGGKLRIDSRAEGGGEAARVSSTVAIKGLSLKDAAGKRLGPLDLDLEQKGTLSLAAGGKSTLESLVVRSDLLQATVRGEAVDALDPAKTAGSAIVSVRADPAALQAKLGDFLGGTTLGGAELRLDGEATFRPDGLSTKGGLKSERLSARTGGQDGASFQASAVDVGFDVALSPASDTTAIRDLNLGAKDLLWTRSAGAKPVPVRDLRVGAAASMKGADLDLQKLAIDGSLAQGGGRGTIRKLGQEGMTAEGRIELRGDAAALADVFAAFSPESGPVTGTGSWEIAFVAESRGAEIALQPSIQVRKLGLDGLKAGGKPAPVRDVDLALVSELALDSRGSGTLTVRSGRLTAPGVDVNASGTMKGFLGEAPVADDDLRLRGAVDPGELSRRCAGLLMGWDAAGAPVAFETTVRRQGAGSAFAGNLKAPDLRITLPPDPAAKAGPRVVTQRDLAVDFDVAMSGAGDSGRLDVRRADLKSRTATASAQGFLLTGGASDADLKVVADAELVKVFEDLGALLSLGDYRLAGATHVDAKVKGQGRTVKIAADTTITGFQATVPGDKGPETVSDPKVVFTADADHDASTTSLVMNKVGIDSTFLKGKLDGKLLNLKAEPVFQAVKGVFTYNPDRLGAVLKPWLPGKLSGSTDEKIAFTLDGKAKETDWVAILRGSTGDGSIGLAPLTMSGMNIQGPTTVDIKGEKVATRSVLKMNGGDLKLDSDLDLRKDAGAVSKVKLEMKGGSANGEMAPILALVNPIFAIADAGAGGALSALLDVDVDLAYRGQVDAKDFGGGFDAFPKERLSGRARIGVKNLVLQGSNVVGQLVTLLGAGAAEKIDVAPVELLLDRGRLAYAQPVQMTLGGLPTKWTGTIGLDQTLDLVLAVPVDDKLAAKHGFLRFWKGQELQIPVKGTSSSPDIRIQDLLANLAQQAIQKELAEKAGGLLGGGGNNPLGGVLGGVFGGGAAQDEKKAQELLNQADTAYAQNRKAESGPMYQKLREAYGKTQIYTQNKARIDQREKER